MAADSNPGRITCAPGGVARNVAENLARLGHAPRLVSAIGDDVFGQSLRQSTAAAGVDTQSLAVLPGQRTASYMSLHGPDGDMAVAVNDMAILEALTPAVLGAQNQLLEQAACMVLDCNLTAGALGFLIHDVAAAHGSPVFVDAVSVAKCQRIAPCLARIHTLKVNRLEAQTLAGMAVQTVADAQAAARRLHQDGVRQVIVSLGEQGVCWCDASGATGHLQAAPVPVVNTSGAGDALLAGLVHGFLNGWSLPQAVDFAMACAELTLQSPRANHAELSLAMLQQHRGHTFPFTPSL